MAFVDGSWVYIFGILPDVSIPALHVLFNSLIFHNIPASYLRWF